MRPLVLYLSLSLFLSLLPPSSAFPALLLPLGLASPPRAAMVASARRPSPLGISMIDFFTPPPVPTGDPSPIVHVSEQGDLEDLLEQGMVCTPSDSLSLLTRSLSPSPPPPSLSSNTQPSHVWARSQETVTAVCVSWHLPSCRKCLALKARFRRIAKDPPCPCIFAGTDPLPSPPSPRTPPHRFDLSHVPT